MKIEDFYPYVLPDVLGCPDPLLRTAIVATAAEFCTETLAWFETQDPISLVEGVSNYELDTPTSSYAITILSAFSSGRQLQSTTLPPSYWDGVESSEPSHYNQMGERGSITVYPKPTGITTQTLLITAAFAPSLSAATLPDFLGQRHTEVIASGVKAKLMATPRTSWENPTLSAYHRQLFRRGIGVARIAEAHGRVPGSIRVKPRSFGV